MSIFRKSTNAEAYLHYFSCAAMYVKVGLAHILFLRALRICDTEFLESEISHIFSVLGKLAYPQPMLKHAFLKAKKACYNNGVLKSTKCTTEQIGDNENISIIRIPRHRKGTKKSCRGIQSLRNPEFGFLNIFMTSTPDSSTPIYVASIPSN